MNLKYSIKIPNNINFFYSKKKNILIIKGPLTQRSLTLKLKIIVLKSDKLILVTSIPCSRIANNEKKKPKSYSW
jgi:hypothetical protein